MIVKTESDMSFVRHNFKPLKNKLLNKYSRAEEHFESLLKMTNMFYVREKGNFRYGTRWCYYDFYIPYYRLYIEIDGSSHDSIEQKKIDKEKEKIIERKKRFIIRLTNEEVLGLKEVSLCYLVKRLCEQRSECYSRSFGFAINEYLENLTKNVNSGIYDMLEDTGIKVEFNKDVFAYCKSTGRMYRFQNECIAKIGLNFTLQEVRNYLVNTDYKRSTLRKYVLAYSEGECIKRVKACMDIDVEFCGNIYPSCTLDDLMPIMNDRERKRWLGIPIPGVEEFIENMGQLGFSPIKYPKKGQKALRHDSFPYHSSKNDASVLVRTFLSQGVLRLYIVHKKNWHGMFCNINEVPSDIDGLKDFINTFIADMCKKYHISFNNKKR